MRAMCLCQRANNAHNTQRHITAGHSQQPLQLPCQWHQCYIETRHRRRRADKLAQQESLQTGLFQREDGFLLQIEFITVNALQQTVQQRARRNICKKLRIKSGKYKRRIINETGKKWAKQFNLHRNFSTSIYLSVGARGARGAVSPTLRECCPPPTETPTHKITK